MRLILITILLFALQSISGQAFKVIKIIDSNLFELEDGRIIKLAGIDSPQLNNQIPFFAETAKEAINYYKEILLRRSVVVQSVSNIDSKNYELVYLWLKYPLEDLDLNRRFLERGFGKFIDNVDSNKKAVLIEAEKYAADNHNGIWNYYERNEYDMLDGDLRGTNTPQIIRIDSTIFKKYFGPRPIYASIPLEILIGSAATVIAGLASGLLYAGIVHEHGEYAGFGAALFGFAIGYVFGFSFGVYLVASHDNPNMSYLEMLGCNLGLTAFMGGIAASFPDGKTKNTIGIVAALSPIIGSLLYVHAFPPTPPTKEELIYQDTGYKKIINFRDYYNATMNFKMELMRIYF